MIEKVRSLIGRKERGAVLPMVAGSLVFLIGMAAFGTDLGWLYVNSLRIQRSADAAALAGVIHMPGFFGIAEQTARDIAAANGHVHGTGGTIVDPQPVVGQARQLEVTVTDQVDTFFLRVFGMDSVTVSKDAIAEYVLPLPLGSPDNEFGNGLNPAQGFWAAIQGPYTKKEHGDPFATHCILSTDDQTCDSSNVEYRPDGYYYGVEVPAGSGITSFDVQLYDAGFYHRGSVTTETGDFRWSNSGTACPGCQPSGPPHDISGATMRFTQYMTDPTPLDHLDNPTAVSQGACSSGAGTSTIAPDQATGTYMNRWATLCRFTGASVIEGVYPLEVQTLGSGHAMSMYGVRACSPSCSTPSGIQPRVFGIVDISIWANISGGVPEFFLAEIEDVHAGKDLIIDLFDPGDAEVGVTNIMTLYGPDDTPWSSCDYTVVSWQDGSVEETGSPSPCAIDATRTVGGSSCGSLSSPSGCKFNGDWLEIVISIPPDYTCDPTADPSSPDDCWWKIHYTYTGSVNDRTTWGAKIVGNPIHLVFG